MVERSQRPTKRHVPYRIPYSGSAPSRRTCTKSRQIDRLLLVDILQKQRLVHIWRQFKTAGNGYIRKSAPVSNLFRSVCWSIAKRVPVRFARSWRVSGIFSVNKSQRQINYLKKNIPLCYLIRSNPLIDFKPLTSTCSYFRGCPIDRLDVAIAYDLPELVGKYKKLTKTKLDQH